MPTVTIDDIAVEMEKGATILDAAQKAGIWIPTLCYHPSLSSGATCRLCMVELDRGDWRQLVTACNYPVCRDIVVSVSNDRAVAARKGVMRLLLARAPENKQLNALARRMGVDGTDYPTVTNTLRDCILCGMCTAVCKEVIGRAAISFVGRGSDRSVSTPFGQPSEDCIGCGACAAICPVGTIQVRIHQQEGEIEISPFKARSKLLVCHECGARMVSVPVAEEVFKKAEDKWGKIDWEKFHRRARLCPKCRRKETTSAVAAVAGGPDEMNNLGRINLLRKED
ncbi:MAG: 2Fe-2S iron-sulfur cluster-binding protein [Phycisphaerae bacterium]|nr:2Fe-2S iron-sulfur cluster-binding protein [Phycisphaerae bacterium]